MDEAMTEYRKALGDRLAQLQVRLPAMLEGKDRSRDAGELLACAQLCRAPYGEHNAGAARFFGEAFAVEPKLAEDLQAEHRYNAWPLSRRRDALPPVKPDAEFL